MSSGMKEGAYQAFRNGTSCQGYDRGKDRDYIEKRALELVKVIEERLG